MKHASKVKPRRGLSEDRRQRMYQFLYEHPVGVLAMVDPNGQPHAVVIYFVVNRQFDIWFLTRAETRKHDNLTRNPLVMMAVYEAETQTVIQITGKAEEITDSYDVNGVAGAVLKASLRAKSPGILPMTKLADGGPYVAFHIKPSQVRMAVYARPDSGIDTDLFETLEAYEIKTFDD